MICVACWLSLSPIDPMSSFLATMDPSIHSAGSCVSLENAVFLHPIYGPWEYATLTDRFSAYTFFPSVYNCPFYIVPQLGFILKTPSSWNSGGRRKCVFPPIGSSKHSIKDVCFWYPFSYSRLYKDMWENMAGIFIPNNFCFFVASA